MKDVLSGLERSVLLLLSLEDEEVAEVMSHLEPRRIQVLARAMMNFSNASREKLAEAFNQLEPFMESAAIIDADPLRLQRILPKALGEERAKTLLASIQSNEHMKGLEGLRWLDASAVAELITNEHPQVVAAVLAHLDHDHAGEVLRLLPERQRNDVILRIATMDKIQPYALQALNSVLENLLRDGQGSHVYKDGERIAANILNFVGTSTEQAVIESVRTFSAPLAQRLVDKMFVFENLLGISDRDMQTLLHELQPNQLLVALKGASTEIREKFFANMSQRAADAMRDDLDAKGPVRLSDVEQEQKEIVRIARYLAEQRQISLSPHTQDPLMA